MRFATRLSMVAMGRPVACLAADGFESAPRRWHRFVPRAANHLPRASEFVVVERRQFQLAQLVRGWRQRTIRLIAEIASRNPFRRTLSLLAVRPAPNSVQPLVDSHAPRSSQTCHETDVLLRSGPSKGTIALSLYSATWNGRALVSVTSVVPGGIAAVMADRTVTAVPFGQPQIEEAQSDPAIRLRPCRGRQRLSCKRRTQIGMDTQQLR